MTCSVCSRVEPAGQHRLDVHDALILIGEIGGGHALEKEYPGPPQTAGK